MDPRQRTKEGIETVWLNGKQIGGRIGVKRVAKKGAPANAIIVNRNKSFNGDLSYIECMKRTGLGRNTYYKYKDELKSNLKIGK